MFISVIIPNYNHAGFLVQRIESVINQTYQNFEIIILDDCSTDSSRPIIENYRNHPKVSHLIFNKENSGSPFKQWEKGLPFAKGEYIWIAESDDYSELTFLEVLTQRISENVGLVYCQSWDVNEKGEKGNTRLYWTEEFKENIWKNDFLNTGKELIPYLKTKNIVPNVSACIIKKSFLVSIFENNPEINKFKFCGDWYLWLILFQQPSVKIKFYAKPLNFFRETKSSSRYFTSLHQKQLRVLEEIILLKRNIHLFKKDEFKKRINKLKMRWFSIHNKANFNSSFFTFSKQINLNPVALFYQFIFFKCKRKLG